MKVGSKNISIEVFGILSFFVLGVAYYFGSRTGKSKAVAGASDQLAKDISKSELSYDLSQYGILAQRIDEAVEPIGTNEDALYTVFTKMRTNSDILQLIKAFGKRGDLIEQNTLPEWIYSDCSKDEIDKINEILSRNGITYQF